MSAATKDRYTIEREDNLVSAPVAEDAVIYAGTLVVWDTTGYLDNGVETAGFRFAGVAASDADNTGGDDGDISIDVSIRGSFRFASSGLTQADVGKKLYLIDNQTVGLAANGSVDKYIYVGRLGEFISATECWVDIQPLQATGAQQYTVQVVGTNATALNLATPAGRLGGTDFYVDAVESIVSYTTSSGALDSLFAVTTDYTVSGGDISMVGNETTHTLVITFIGHLL